MQYLEVEDRNGIPLVALVANGSSSVGGAFDARVGITTARQAAIILYLYRVHVPEAQCKARNTKEKKKKKLSATHSGIRSSRLPERRQT